MKNIKVYGIISVLCLMACFSKKQVGGNDKSSQVDGKGQFHVSSDDSLLSAFQNPTLLPYNRIVKSAGEEIFFGDPEVENHTLDCKLLSDDSTLVVEDRYGIAIIGIHSHIIKARFTYADEKEYKGLTSTYSGLKCRSFQGKTLIYWSAASDAEKHLSKVMIAEWDGVKLGIKSSISFAPLAPSPLALPNEVLLTTESGRVYLYVVLNGNNQLVKIEAESEKVIWSSPTGVAPYGLAVLNHRIYVTNWGGSIPTDTLHRETAGVPFGKAYIDPKTGAVSEGTVSVFEDATGKTLAEIKVGLHPNAILSDPVHHLIYASCGNSDRVYVMKENPFMVVDSISIKLDRSDPHLLYFGDSPTAMSLDTLHEKLYVTCGMDNAVAVIGFSQGANFLPQKYELLGFIPTGAYPAGIDYVKNTLFICNLEGKGAWVNSLMLNPSKRKKSIPEVKSSAEGDYNSHHQLASVSIIPVPSPTLLAEYTEKVKRYNFLFRAALARELPRAGVDPVPVPIYVGEPSVFKHVLYIIKENRTYDQVLGDMPSGRGAPNLCVYGDSITPNQHALARKYLLLDNFYASGKCSAEGHQWADEGMVSDYIEKNMRSWFRSYPHVQTDALVYTPTGFIWNDALDHGKSVRIYGEASKPIIDPKYTWQSIFEITQKGEHFPFKNYSTISRVRPILSEAFPASDSHLVNDVYRAHVFIDELKHYESIPGDSLPNLMVMALSNDHTVGARPGFPIPKAMVADNDLALGKIIDAVTHSRFYASTAIFVMEDDSQTGWDHISAYRTTGFVISPYSSLGKTVTTNYNQTSVVRTIEQILGIPPMNALDATALPMFDCFQSTRNLKPYTYLKNRIPLDQMNPALSKLKGEALKWAKISLRPEYDHLDGGDDEDMNRVLWYLSKGSVQYPICPSKP